MGTVSIGFVSSILGSALQLTGVAAKGAAKGSETGTASSTAQPQDSGQLSPLAQLVNNLQQLQQARPAQYAQVTRQISTNLQNAAQSAQSEGNPAGASQLSQLAREFSSASSSGQLPGLQELIHGVGRGHLHHAEAAGTVSNHTSGFTSGSSGAQGSSGNYPLGDWSNFAPSGSTSGLDPMAIINNTLSGNGIKIGKA